MRTLAGLPLERFVRGLLFLHLALLPLGFSRATVEGFEFVKFLGLLLSAILIVMFGAIALPQLSVRRLRYECKQPLVVAAMGLLASAAIATLFSLSPQISFYGHHEDFEGLLTLLGYGAIFVAARWAVRTTEQRCMMMAAVAVASAVATVYGYLQIFEHDGWEWTNYSMIGGWKRPFATFGHPNFLGAYLVLALPGVLWLAAQVRPPIRNVLLVLAIAMASLTVLTLSRGAWLGLFTAALIAFAGWRFSKQPNLSRRARWAMATALVATVTLVAIIPGVSERSGRFFDSAGRLEIWSAACRAFEDRPLTGCGPDVFAQIFGRHGSISYRLESWRVIPARAHNEFLHILATQGIVGLMAMLVACAALILTLRRAWRQDPKQRGMIIAMSAAFGGFAATEFFGFTVIACGSLTSVLAGMASRLGEESEPFATTDCVRSLSPMRGFIACGAFAVGIWLTSTLIVDPWRASVYSQQAQQMQATSLENALELDERAVRICPREPVFWNRLAMHLEEAGRTRTTAAAQIPMFERARLAYSEAAARDREDGFYCAGQARASGELARLGRVPPEQAYAVFDRALLLDPGNAYTYVDASRAALGLRDAERMRCYCDPGLLRFPHFGMLLEQAALRWLLLNRPAEASIALQAAIDGDWKGHLAERESVQWIFEELNRRMEAMRGRSPSVVGN